MFDENLSFYLSPLGFSVRVNKIDKEEDFYVYSTTISGHTHDGKKLKCDLDFCIPAPYDGRIFRIEGASATRTRVVCNKAFFDITDKVNVIPKNLTVKKWQYLVLDAVNNAIQEACFDWKFGNEAPHTDMIDAKILEWFNTSPFVMDVDPNNKIQVASVEDMVVLDIHESGIGHNNRVFMEEWLGMLDPCSTPSSERINLVYRLADGAKIVGGKIVKSDQTFCKTVVNNAIASRLNPRRNYLLRTTFENTSVLVESEEPKVFNKNSQLSGVNLLTAVMHLDEHTFEDCIAISESAAARMGCYVEKNQDVRSQSPIKIHVKVDDVIKPGDVIAEDETGTIFRFSKMKVPAAVIKVEENKRLIYGRLFNCVRLTFCSVYPLINGDKLSNRGAVKGVVKVIKDTCMPVTPQGQVVDVCISPESVYKRRCMALYWEMMASKQEGRVEADFFEAKPSFKELAVKYGDKEQLHIAGTDLKEKTFIGTIFWLRLNKHAEDALSVKGEGIVTNQYGLKVDDASASGQRRDFAKSLAMISRDLGPILDESVKDTLGVSNLRNFLDVVLSEE